MTNPNPKLDAFFTKDRKWRAEMHALRAILLDTPLNEELKWYQPCYTHDGSNVAILGNYKEFCTLAFFRGAILDDPHDLLVQQGPNTRSGRVIKFTGLDQIEGREAILKAYVQNAIAVQKAGLKVDFQKADTVEMPDELTHALAADPVLKSAFEALTPGRQRAYKMHISAAKQSATRTARIKKSRPWILAGKGPNER